jgi:hypothetical protein
MNNKFDELAKQLAQSTTRRQALKKFSLGLAGLALTCFGLANSAKAGTCIPNGGGPCKGNSECCSKFCNDFYKTCECLSSGWTCNNDSECCSGVCQSYGKDFLHRACA